MDGSRPLPRLVNGPPVELSARRRSLNRGQATAVAAVAGALAALFLASTVLAGVALRWLFAAGFLAVISFRLATVVLSVAARRPESRISEADLPHYTVVVALKDEEAVAAQLVARLSALDYPADRLTGYLVVEPGDHRTRRALERTRRPAWLTILTAPPGWPTTKPRALNVALSLARPGLLTVYDAEDEPHPGQLREAAARFVTAGDDLGCLQAPLRIRRSGRSMTWLERQFALEYAALFEVTLPALAAMNLPLPLGGTSNHFRGIMYQTHLKW